MQYIESEIPNRPVRTTGFRPIRSESLLQCRTVHAWVAKNKDCWDPNRSSSKLIQRQNEPVAYHYSNIIADFRIVLRNVQTPYELDVNASEG